MFFQQFLVKFKIKGIHSIQFYLMWWKQGAFWNIVEHNQDG